MFSCSYSHCPSTGCVPAENAVYKSTDIFRKLKFQTDNVVMNIFRKILIPFLKLHDVQNAQ
jgi:hypothetical protein